MLLVLPAIAAVVSAARGAEPTEAPKPAPLEYRRIYAPAHQWQDWPRDHLRYVPMKPADFERLVHAAETSEAEIPAPTATLTSAQYRATLEANSALPNEALSGEALLTVQLAGKREGLLALEPCGLAITQASWQDSQEPPEIGLGAEGNLTVRVRQSGTLRLEWSLRGQADAQGAWQFDLALPRCPTSALLLDLPANVQPRTVSGVPLSQTTEGGQTRWRIELGGHPRLPLRIVPVGEAEAGRRLALVREVLAYDLSLHGLDLSAELQLDVHHEPLRELVIRLDPRLKLVKAQCGETAIPWSLLAPAGEDQGARILLALPEPLQGTGRVIRLGAVAPLELERRWRLPTIHTEGMFWQEGSATIGIRAPLSLKQLVATHGRQSKTGNLSGSRPGESVDLQYFAEDAGVDVVLERTQAQLQIASGTSVQLSREEMRAQVVAELSTTEGEVFQWEAELGRQWLVDTVETQPADVLGESWEDNGNGKLLVHLNKPVSPTRPVRLILTARRLQSAFGQLLGLADLVPLRGAEGASRRQLLTVYAVEPYRLQVNAAEGLRRIEPGKLSAAERNLFVEPPRNVVFETGSGSGLQISLVSPKPSYTATVRVEATALRTEATGTDSYWLREAYAVHCVPEAARVDRVLIHFCRPRPAPPQWSWGSGGEGPVEARRLSAAEQASASMDTRGETWELRFRQAKEIPFEIRASRLVEWKEQATVSLACVPEATQQQGILVVGSAPGMTIRIENQRLEPLPLDDLAPDLLGTARAKFRYAPMADAVHADRAVITITRQAPVLPAAWIWNGHLESRYQVEGTGRHTLGYYLENNGLPRLELTLPAASSLDKLGGVWIDGQPVPWQMLGNAHTRRLAIDLPADRRYPLVCLQFQTEGNALETGRKLAPPLPTVELPLLAQHWTVWLPPGYQTQLPGLWGPLGAAPLGSPPTLGLWGQSHTASPFDPASLNDWRELAGNATRAAAGAAAAAAPQRPSTAPWNWTSPGDADSDLRGWTVRRLEIPPGRLLRLSVIDADSMRSYQVMVLLTVFALLAWLARERVAISLVVFGLSILAASLLAEPYALLASGAVLGSGLALVFYLIRRKPPQPRAAELPEPQPPAAPTVSHAPGIAVLLLALGLSATAASAHAQEAARPPAAGPRQVHNVLIPVDAEQRPTGDNYFVPESLYQQLQQQAAATSATPQDWLLKSALYRGTLARQSVGEQFALSELKAIYTLEVFQPSTRIRLPLGREGVNLLPDGARLDGSGFAVGLAGEGRRAGVRGPRTGALPPGIGPAPQPPGIGERVGDGDADSAFADVAARTELAQRCAGGRSPLRPGRAAGTTGSASSGGRAGQ